MSWKADQIYSKPNPDLIKYLCSIEGFSEELFLVNDFEGIRSDWTRSFMLSERRNENSIRKHSLPKDGLLVIKPTMYMTGYDNDEEMNEFWDKYKEYPDDKWNFINSISTDKMDLNFVLTENQLKLFNFLKLLNIKFNTPILYYYCIMWGGDIEEEYAIVFDNEIKIYQYDYESKKNIELVGNKRAVLKSTILQTSFKYLDLELPTWFFALHEASFDWKKYQLKKENIFM